MAEECFRAVGTWTDVRLGNKPETRRFLLLTFQPDDGESVVVTRVRPESANDRWQMERRVAHLAQLLHGSGIPDPAEGWVEAVMGSASLTAAQLLVGCRCVLVGQEMQLSHSARPFTSYYAERVDRAG